jgi:hypothetical protein
VWGVEYGGVGGRGLLEGGMGYGHGAWVWGMGTLGGRAWVVACYSVWVDGVSAVAWCVGIRAPV